MVPLTVSDIKRLSSKGYKLSELVVMFGGERKLRNHNGSCFFLKDGVCSIYDDRPTGCRLYPLVIDYRGRVRIDPMCRHSDEFKIDYESVKRISRLIKKLKAEKRQEIP